MKIYANDDGASGCAWYRMFMPLRELEANGHQVKFSQRPFKMSKGIRPDLVLEDARAADVTVAQRLVVHESLGAWRRLSRDTRLVYEIDDDVFNIGPENYDAYNTYLRGEVRDAVKHYAATSDLVTVTNDRLAAIMGEYCGNVVILPNHVPGWVLDLPAPQGDRPAVGWMGGSSHGLDILQVASPLQKFLRKFPGWDAVLIGTDFRPSVNHPRCGFIPWIHVSDDPDGFYKSIDFDIGVAPLCDGRFEQSKSYIKALEYAARGIPVIASDVAPYREFVVDGVNGFLVRSQNEWLDRLCTLASDEGLRLSMAAKAKDIARQHTIDTGWVKWQQAYEGLMR